MINGILNIYKEKGYTSHDVVARLRRIAGQKKIGHTGTLDPDAEGVLPVCLGRATKVCDMLTDRDKTYEAVLLLGRTTDTQDISGTVLSECSTEDLEPEKVEECILGFAGEYDQIPPMYSALKVNGRKLYELAREGKTVERKSRRVVIRSIRILEMELPRVRMEVTCSKGTYIRTLCQDIGERLGTGGCMESLLRTRVGRFQAGDAFLVYPGKEEALASLRLKVFADGLQDYRLLKTLEQRKGRPFVTDLLDRFGYLDFFTYPHDGLSLLRLHDEVCRLLCSTEE